MSKEEWYYAEDGEQVGPTSSEEIRRLVTAGKIGADDLVWREGMDDWLPAGEIPGLLEAKKKPKPAVVKPKAEWYYAEDGEQLGPISEADLRKKIEQKKIQADDLIWREGMEDWLPAAQIPGMQLFPKKPKPARKATSSAGTSAQAAKESKKPKPVRKQSEPAPPLEEELEPPPVQTEPEPEDPFASSQVDLDVPEDDVDEYDDDYAEEEAWEQSEEYLLQKEEELFGDSGPSRSRPSHSSWPEQPPATREILREITKEKSVLLSPDAQLSSGAVLLQLLCWALCGIAVLGGAVYCFLKLNFESESKLMIVLYGTAAVYVFSRAVQRCLELGSQTKRRR